MSASRDLAKLLTAASPFTSTGTAQQAELSFRQGIISAWDAAAGTNTVHVGGTNIHNVAVLVTGDSLVLGVGDLVGLLRFKQTYFILGRITEPSGFSNFLIPVPMYPMFESTRTSGTASNINTLRVSASTIFTEQSIWQGRLSASSPFVRVSGIWGNLTGTQAVTYRLYVNAVLIGSFTTSGGLVVGPTDSLATFSIANFVGQPFNSILMTAQSTVSNADLIACHLLGMYQ